MTQLIITYLLVAGAFTKAIWTIYQALTSKESRSSCGGGCSGCGAKNELMKAMGRKRNHTPSIINIKRVAH